ncbi:MAG: glycosyltransferase family 2 protein [Chloroflexi bacterium]|nr:glycosyltransferase family 2 protein [Chloroflexota bacterium]
MFWGSTATIVYTYVLFPVLVLLRSVLRPRPISTGAITPSVSVIIAAYNEAAGIAQKLDNLLALDYPTDRLQIVVASDGSSDATNSILGSYVGRGVTPLFLPRSGKSRALNAAAAAAGGDVLVFSDANSIFAHGALRALVRPFADPNVGGVAGNQVYWAGTEGDATTVGERRYWNFDRLLKAAQSRAGSVTGATGAIYAVRRELFREIPPGVNDDFITSLRVVEQGYRLVFARDAIAYEPVGASRDVEFERKVRIMTRGLHCTVAIPKLLDPRRYGFFSLQLISHKLLMRAMAPFLVLAAVSAVGLSRRHWVYLAAGATQLAFYTCALIGLLFARRDLGRRKPFALPAYFCFVTAASVRAWWNVLRAQRVDLWATQRGGGESSE